ncbi:hypothetical protein D9M73_236760 [compost metagenome]
MVVDHGDHRMQLDVRAGQTGVCFQEPSALTDVTDKGAASMAHVVHECLAHPHAAAYGNAKQRGVLAFVAEHHVRVILQVLPDTGKFVVYGDALGLELCLQTNP